MDFGKYLLIEIFDAFVDHVQQYKYGISLHIPEHL